MDSVPTEAQAENIEIELDADENLYFLNYNYPERIVKTTDGSVTGILYLHSDSLNEPDLDGYDPTGAFSIDRQTGAIYEHYADETQSITAKGKICKIESMNTPTTTVADVGTHGYGGGSFLYVSPGGDHLIWRSNTTDIDHKHILGHLGGIDGTMVTESRSMGNLAHASGIR